MDSSTEVRKRTEIRLHRVLHELVAGSPFLPNRLLDSVIAPTLTFSES